MNKKERENPYEKLTWYEIWNYGRKSKKNISIEAAIEMVVKMTIKVLQCPYVVLDSAYLRRVIEIKYKSWHPKYKTYDEFCMHLFIILKNCYEDLKIRIKKGEGHFIYEIEILELVKDLFIKDKPFIRFFKKLNEFQGLIMMGTFIITLISVFVKFSK